MKTLDFQQDQKTIILNDLSIEDARVYRILRATEPSKQAQRLQDFLAMGAIIFDRTGQLEEADFVSQRVEHLILQTNYALERRSSEIFDSIRTQFDPERAGSLIAPVSSLVQRTQQELNTKLMESVRAVREAQERIASEFDPGRDGTVLRQFLDRFEVMSREVSQSPMLQAKFDELRDEMRTMVQGIKASYETDRQVQETRDEMIEGSPQRGLVFEEQVSEDLLRIAEIRNDVIDRVGSSTGKGTSKKGDLVYLLSSIRARIVFEMKDYGSSRFTFSKVRDLMTESLGNRDAQFGVFLVKDESCLPEGVGKFGIFDDFIIATYENLEVATKTAIILTHQRMARMGSGEGPDWLSIGTSVHGIKEQVEELSDLESTVATTTKNVNKIGDGIRRISRALNEKVEFLLSQISKGESQGS